MYASTEKNDIKTSNSFTLYQTTFNWNQSTDKMNETILITNISPLKITELFLKKELIYTTTYELFAIIDI